MGRAGGVPVLRKPCKLSSGVGLLGGACQDGLHNGLEVRGIGIILGVAIFLGVAALLGAAILLAGAVLHGVAALVDAFSLPGLKRRCLATACVWGGLAQQPLPEA